MTPTAIIAVLFWATALFATTSTISDTWLRNGIVNHWRVLFLLAAINICWRIPPRGIFFHGLEYEDAYIYSVAGRQIVQSHVPAPPVAGAPFSVNACQVGSISACEEWEPFPEHLLGFPYVVAVSSRFFGYTPQIGSWINLVTSCLSIGLIFFITLEITPDARPAILATLIYALTPAFSSYGLETSAEPWSAFLILLTLWFYLKLTHWRLQRTLQIAITWLAYTGALLLSQTTKREDLVLSILFPIMLPLAAVKHAPAKRRLIISFLVLASSVLAVILAVRMNLVGTALYERQLLSRFPLSAGTLLRFTVSYLSSFLIPRWYGGTSVVVLVGVTVALFRRDRTVIPAILLLALITIYASHIRGYHEMESGQSEPAAALRFSMNLMGLWSIVAGLGAGIFVEEVLRRWHPPHRRKLLVGLGSALCTLSLVASWHLRNDEVEDEGTSRIAPAMAALRLAQASGLSHTVVSMEPLVLQMYGSTDVRIIDLESVEVDTLVNELSPTKDGEILFLDDTDRLNNDDLSRYGEPVRILLQHSGRVVASGDGYTVSRVQAAPGN